VEAVSRIVLVLFCRHFLIVFIEWFDWRGLHVAGVSSFGNYCSKQTGFLIRIRL
jgi:hypothetical protein